MQELQDSGRDLRNGGRELLQDRILRELRGEGRGRIQDSEDRQREYQNRQPARRHCRRSSRPHCQPHIGGLVREDKADKHQCADQVGEEAKCHPSSTKSATPGSRLVANIKPPGETVERQSDADQIVDEAEHQHLVVNEREGKQRPERAGPEQPPMHPDDADRDQQGGEREENPPRHLDIEPQRGERQDHGIDRVVREESEVELERSGEVTLPRQQCVGDEHLGQMTGIIQQRRNADQRDGQEYQHCARQDARRDEAA